MDGVDIAGVAALVLMILSNVARLWLVMRRLSETPLRTTGRQGHR
ncbi:MAG TPA: hypothetical protein VMB81_33250 [Candidatus Sulfotelmatobacter sp.]|nr:hypothetical protein [Candidatus Sulfotelmatobacter sp.]